MSSVADQSNRQNKAFDFLCVDDFIKRFDHARALATAFETGLIDFMMQTGKTDRKSLENRWRTGRQPMKLLLSLLSGNGVISEKDGWIQLTDDFLDALRFRDLMQLKLQMTHFAAHDFLNYFSDLICRPDQFFQKSQFCRLFDYGRSIDHEKDNFERTKQWMRITTTLTKYEAEACLASHDFSSYRKILDIGGNSGEFVLRICRRHPEIQATVFDLPLVCDVGLSHVRSEPEAGRISFVKGDALIDPLPGGFDLVMFKSMLHDWPEKEAGRLIVRAAQALKHGGTLLIFERGPFDTEKGELPYSAIPMLLFLHAFRGPSFYEDQLRSIGFEALHVQPIDLEMPFFLLMAIKEHED